MELKKDRDFGLFTKKIYTGHLFAQKCFDDFLLEAKQEPKAIDIKKHSARVNDTAARFEISTEEAEGIVFDELVQEKARSNYADYLEVEKYKEYVIMREASNSESRSIQVSDIDDKILSRLSAEAQVEHAKNMQAVRTEKESDVLKLVLDCIVGSSMTIDGKPAPLERVREEYEYSTIALGYITTEWMAGPANFPKKSGRN